MQDREPSTFEIWSGNVVGGQPPQQPARLWNFLKSDRDECWRNFAGWRVNYDTPLVALAGLTDAPAVPWSSDRIRGDYRDLLAQARGMHKPRRRESARKS